MGLFLFAAHQRAITLERRNIFLPYWFLFLGGLGSPFPKEKGLPMFLLALLLQRPDVPVAAEDEAGDYAVPRDAEEKEGCTGTFACPEKT